MSEMVKRVAEAIRVTDMTTTGLMFTDLLEAMARAAIEAMREPSVPMIASGWRELRRAHFPRLGSGPGLVEAYSAMIDKALEE